MTVVKGGNGLAVARVSVLPWLDQVPSDLLSNGSHFVLHSLPRASKRHAPFNWDGATCMPPVGAGLAGRQFEVRTPRVELGNSLILRERKRTFDTDVVGFIVIASNAIDREIDTLHVANAVAG